MDHRRRIQQRQRPQHFATCRRSVRSPKSRFSTTRSTAASATPLGLGIIDHDQIGHQRVPWRRQRKLLEPALAGQQPVHQAVTTTRTSIRCWPQGNTAGATAAAAQPIQPSGHSNLYGFTATGPLHIPKIVNLRNKVFWTLSYNGERDAKPETSNSYAHVVPSAAEKTGNFSDLLNVKSDGLNYQLFDPFSVKVDPSRTGTHYVRTPLPGQHPARLLCRHGLAVYKNYTEVLARSQQLVRPDPWRRTPVVLRLPIAVTPTSWESRPRTTGSSVNGPAAWTST